MSHILRSWKPLSAVTLLAAIVGCAGIPWTFEKIEHVADPNCALIDSAPTIFHDLCALERKDRQQAISIVHLGDSHIAADSMTKTIRHHFQAIWGNAGRGLVTPPDAFPGMSAAGIELQASEGWEILNSVTNPEPDYGISGIIARSTRNAAVLSLKSTFPTDFAQVVLAPTKTSGGAVIVRTDVAEAVVRSPTDNPLSIHLPVGWEATLSIKSWSNAPLQVTAAGFVRDDPGIRYYNFGLPSATSDTMNNWGSEQAFAELVSIDPSMVVLGYGTNEGFNDSLNLNQWTVRRRQMLELLKRMLPNATLLIIGPPDAARRLSVEDTSVEAASDSSRDDCIELTPQQQSNYQMQSSDHASISQWHAPPNLDRVRNTLRDLAQEHGAMYWDWSTVMGKTCGTHLWTRTTPPLARGDHVHLTSVGYVRSAEAFTAWFLRQYRQWLQ